MASLTNLDVTPHMTYPKDLDSNNELECLLIPTYEQIETMYDDYVDEICKPLDFEEN